MKILCFELAVGVVNAQPLFYLELDNEASLPKINSMARPESLLLRLIKFVPLQWEFTRVSAQIFSRDS